MIGELDLGPIEKRLAGATPGPWQAEDLPYDGTDDPKIISVDEVYIAQTVYDMQSFTREHDVDADTIFIANAPTDIADLLAEVKRLRQDRAEVRRDALLEGAKAMCDGCLRGRLNLKRGESYGHLHRGCFEECDANAIHQLLAADQGQGKE